MEIDLTLSAPRPDDAPLPSRRHRQPWMPLLSAVLQLAGPHAELLRHSERPWASATFSGARHRIALAFAGVEGIDAADAFIAALPEHEFAIAGQLVADATVAEVEQVTLPTPAITVDVELLLLQDG